MEKKGGSAGARQRRGNLAGDDARLPHAGDDDAAAAIEQDADGLLEAIVEPIDERENRGGFCLQHLAGERDINTGDSTHARAPEAVSAVSRVAASIRLSFMMRGSSRSRR